MVISAVGGGECAASAHTGSAYVINLHAIFAAAVYTTAVAAEVLAGVPHSKCRFRLKDSLVRNVQHILLLHVYYAYIYKCL